MPTQRDFREPKYTYQFDSNFRELMVSHQALSTARERREQLEKEITRLENMQDRNHFLSGEQQRSLDRDFERIRIEMSGCNNMDLALTNKIDFLASTLGGFFNEITDDLQGGYITFAQYQSYLRKYQLLISSGNNHSCYEKSPYEKIKSEIISKLPEPIKL